MLEVPFPIQLTSKGAKRVSELNKEMDAGGGAGEPRGQASSASTLLCVWAELFCLPSLFSGTLHLKIRGLLGPLVY